MLAASEQLLALAQSQPMIAVLLPLALTALLATLAFSSAHRRHSSAYARPTATLPFVGNTLDLMLFHSERMYDWFADECAAAGEKPWLLSLAGSVPVVVVATPALLEDVTKTQFAKFTKDEIETNHFADLFGKGILFTDRDEWFFHRKTASTLFSHQMLRDVMYAAVHDKLVTLCHVLRQYEARDSPVSLKTVLAHFTSDVFGKIGFGVDLECLKRGVAGRGGNEFVDAFAETTRALFYRLVKPRWLWRLERYLNVGMEKRFSQSLAVLDAFIFRIINESFAANHSPPAVDDVGDSNSESSSPSASRPPPPPKNLISIFLSSHIKEDVEIKSKAFESETHLIRDTVVNFIFAGKDTTSHSLSFFIVMMNRYPAVLAELRAELRKNLPAAFTASRKDGSELVHVPSMDDLAQLVYLEAAIRENLRLNPIVPLASRQAAEDLVLCDGTPIARGTRVSLPLYFVNRNPAIWGDDVLAFKPERWFEPHTRKLRAVSPFEFTAFFGGPRQCIGMRFAMLEMKCALAVLLANFDFVTVADPWSLGYDVGFTMSVKGPLEVRVASTHLAQSE